MRQTSPIFLLIFWSKFLIPCTDVAAALESSRTRRIYPPTASQIIEDGLVLKEENCLFPWLSCVKITAQKIPSLALTASYLWLLKPFCVPGRPWPSLLLSLLHGAWGAVNVPFFKGSVKIHQTGTDEARHWETTSAGIHVPASQFLQRQKPTVKLPICHLVSDRWLVSLCDPATTVNTSLG